MSIKPLAMIPAYELLCLEEGATALVIPAGDELPGDDCTPLYAIPDTHRVVAADSLAVDAEIIKALTGALSELVLECMEGGAPSNRALMRARASLPAGVAGSVCK